MMRSAFVLAAVAVLSGTAGAARAESPAKGAAPQPFATLPYTPSLDPAAMDKAVDPCVDFFQYSCGGWMKMNPIPSDQARWSVYGKAYSDNQQFLWGLLQQAGPSRPSRTPDEQRIGDYFAACMDEPAIEKKGAAPLAADLKAIDAVAKVSDLPALVGRLQSKTGDGGFLFGFGSNQDFGDSSQVIAFAGAGGLSLPDRDYYVKDDAKSKEIRDKYLAHVARMMTLAGETDAQARADAATVLRIETALARVALTRVERRDPQKIFHRMAIADLQKLTPSFAWTPFLAAVSAPAITTVNVTEPEFYKGLEAQLTATPLADWKSYLRWHLVNARAGYLSKTFVQADFDFFRGTLRGVKQMQPRWKRCVGLVDRDLGEALGRVFVEKTFPPPVKQQTLDMVVEIEKAMEARIKDLPWMGPETKKEALAKLSGMRNKIGYPEHWRDYSAVKITAGDFLGDADQAVSFESRRQLGKIGKPVDRNEWSMTPPTVNAYYDQSMNDMNFPAGVLLPPLYDPKIDAAPNYGDTGGTIGHELTHGFDDSGRKFDSKGNLRDWWTAEDGKEFDKRVQCVKDQYSQYTIVDDVKINGNLTAGEDVADLGGTIIAYYAWKNATRAQELKPMDGLTPDQRFFVGFAQWACGDETLESRRVSALTNPHSPNVYRINGVVPNMPEFREAFGCKVGQPMVKEPVCRVW